MISSIKNKYSIGFFSVMLMFLLVVQTTFANTIVRSGQTVSVAEENSVAGDLYSAAGTINISGTVEQDALLIGGQVTVNGTINEDVFVIGGNVDIHGKINDDLRIVGGEVTIAESISGDVAILGGSVNILSSASIEGDLLIYGADVVIEGSVAGNILGSVGSLRIDSFVGGNTDVTVTSLVLGDQANLAGSLTYDSLNNLERSLNATVSGDIVRNDPVMDISEDNSFDFLVPSLMILFSVLSWFLVSKKTLNSVVNRAIVKSPRPSLIGFALLFLAPIAALILVFSMIGSMIGFVILFAYLLILVLALIMMPAVLGQLVMLAFSKSGQHVNLLSILIGVLVITALSQLPVIGTLLIVFLLLISIGALAEAVLAKNK